MVVPNRFIVTTTINGRTEAIDRFDSLTEWTLIVVGDRRTPQGYRLRNGIYLSPDEQSRFAPELSELIGWNSIQRRNIGFLLALESGADVVATVDDDNIPYDSWGKNIFVGQEIEVTSYEASNGCFDPVGATEHAHLWHRGYPIQLLSSRDYAHSARKRVRVDVQADFWDGDPDIDAICRLEHAPDVVFSPASFPMASNAVSPFNSQNTFLSREALQHYFVLPHVGRMDDIWASYHLQALGFNVVYGPATVRQDRNAQDLTRNLVDEFLGYEKNVSLVRAINRGDYDPAVFWPQRTLTAYESYRRRVSCDFHHHRWTERQLRGQFRGSIAENDGLQRTPAATTRRSA